jgi:hypothetical protein
LVVQLPSDLLNHYGRRQVAHLLTGKMKVQSGRNVTKLGDILVFQLVRAGFASHMKKSLMFLHFLLDGRLTLERGICI